MAIWDRRHVLKAGGFDPILYSHEGAELTARPYPIHRPEAFLYEPRAVLRHDYASSPETLEGKRRRHDHANAYLRLRNSNLERIIGAFKGAASNLEAEAPL